MKHFITLCKKNRDDFIEREQQQQRLMESL
jgi:hypothetical protein